MCRELTYLVSFVLVLSLAGSISAQLPEGWTSQDVGSPTPGSASELNGEWTVGGNGNDIWGTADNFHYVHVPLPGSGQMIARVTSVGDGTNNWAKGGVMIRETLDAGSVNSCVMVTPSSGGGLTFQIRATTDGSSTSQHTQAPNVVPPYWVKIVREGNEFTGWRSDDGVTWTQQGIAQTVSMAKDVYIGLCVTSHADGEVRTYTFDNVSVELAKIALSPAPADGTVLAENWTSLAWEPAAAAVSHDLYIGENYDDVAAGTGDTFWANLPTAASLVGFATYPYPTGLTPGVTYYWRVDEVEADGTKNTGRIWSFSMPAATAEEPVPADGAMFVDPATTLSWAPGFGVILHYVYFGENAADVAAGAPDTSKGGQPDATYNPGPLEKGKTYYWRVDEFDAATTHTGAVWSFSAKPDIPISDPNLVGWWMMDNFGTGTVIDFSGYGRDGTINGDPQWVAGYDGDALEFDGSDDYVNIDGYTGVVADAGGIQQPFSITAWVRSTDSGDRTIASWGTSSSGIRVDFRLYQGRLRVEHGAGNLQADTNLIDGEWHHVALTAMEGATIGYPDCKLYLDAEDDSRTTTDPDAFAMTPRDDVSIGRRAHNNQRHFLGALDDVRIYDKELTQAEIQEVMLRPNLLMAWAPSPADGSAPDIENAAPLNWSPGDKVAQHDVYVGSDAQAVADADASDTTGIYRGRQAATSYTPPQALEPEQTYYWRIDQYNTDGSISPGRVWSLTVGNFVLADDFEAYNDINPDEPGSNRIFLTWIGGDADPANGSQVGHNTAPFAEQSIVNRGLQSMPLFYNNTGGIAYSEAKMTLTSGRDWTQGGVKALTLSFRGYGPSVGRFVEDPAGTYTMTARGEDIWNVGPGAGEYGDEFHFAYKQLTGAGSIVAKVEGMSSTNAWSKACVMIRDTLDPGSAHGMMCVTPTSGVSFQRRITAGEASAGDTQAGITAPQWVKIELDLAGNITASYSADGVSWTQQGTELIPMTTPVYIGLALTSHNADQTCQATFSNVTITGQVGPVWASQDIGITSNDPQPMYVAVANSTGAPAVVYNEDPAATQVDTWTDWNIELKDLSDQGVNLADVDSIAIGLGNKDNPVASGAGKMYFDDIRVYLPRCVASIAQPAGDLNDDCAVDMADVEVMADNWLASGYDVTVVAVSDANLEAHYELDGNLLDSSGHNYHGDPCGTVAYAAGMIGQAIDLVGGSHVTVAGYAGVVGMQSRTCTAWINAATIGEIMSWGQNVAGQKWIFRVQESNGVIGAIRVEVNGGYIVGTTDMRDGQWHHVAAVLDSDGTPDVIEMSLYVDGVREVVSASGDEPIDTAADGVVIVGRSPWGNRPFVGQIDDVRIYSRVLSQGELANLAGLSAGETLLQPLQTFLATTADIDLNDDEAIDFKDFAVLAGQWLDEQLWPQP